jgi:uncharacterized protein (AIM24 family)
MKTVMTETQPSVTAAAEMPDGRFLDHLSSAADMVAARRFREGEVEILHALSISPADARALKLLTLVRFKLGRWQEAHTLCRELAAAMPGDADIRMKLGLIALKLDRVDESARELELSTRLAPDEPRAWSYLGFVYARRGEPARAAAAFRRAGQDARAAEVEQRAGATPLPSASLTPLGSIPATVFEPTSDRSGPLGAGGQRTDPDGLLPKSPSGKGAIFLAPLVAHAVSRLMSAAEQPASVGATARLAIGDEVFVRVDAVVACSGAARWEPAKRRSQGRATEERLGGGSGATDAERFCRLTGQGEVLVAAPAGRLVPLRLEGDILYVLEDRVLAFEGTLSWEYGRIPRAAVPMVQFRGRGLVAIRVDGELDAVRVTPECSAFVSAPHLLGWTGRVVARGTGGGAVADAVASDAAIASTVVHDDTRPNVERGVRVFDLVCEGDGVVLLDVRGPERIPERESKRQ